MPEPANDNRPIVEVVRKQVEADLIEAFARAGRVGGIRYDAFGQALIARTVEKTLERIEGESA